MLTSDNTTDTPLEGDSPATSAPTRKRSRRSRLEASSLGLAVLIALAGAGLYYMHWRTKDALALLSGADAQIASLNSVLAGGQKDMAVLTRSLRETREVVSRFSQRDNARLASGTPVSRDLFQFDALEPRQIPTKAVGPSVAAREEAKEKALKAARALTLQSIMFGSSKRSCLIDGKLYFENTKVGEFVIARITPDAVVVRSGDYSFELRLRK